MGKVMNVSKFNIKKANKQYNKLDSEYEIQLHQFSQVRHEYLTVFIS